MKCPVCGNEPKLHNIKTGFVLSCVGERHTVHLDSDGNHSVSLYRAETIDELKAAWPRFFPEKVPA